ncbi:hypothetical protein DPMN_047231 [Dreissena polymorpha]|uniref:Uncharacterized protein n=1 Tax=Dreissena polymorpha TaxID=45954 RepID=A0A9D4D948_DREPO|nr:hypothetical protein DPMN_047231 [Dreissena polymorpha]
MITPELQGVNKHGYSTRVGSENADFTLRSKQDRTINARVSPSDRLASDSLNAYTSAGDRLIARGPPHDARRTPDDARDDARTMNPMSGARRAITRKKTSAADRMVLNFVNHRTTDGSDVSSLPDACRSDTSAGDRIICEA